MQGDFVEQKQFEGVIANPLRRYLNQALFNLNCPLGRNVNLFGIVLIVLTVLLAMIGTVDGIDPLAKRKIEIIELVITCAFAVEYLLRIIAARRPITYIFSFYGMVDLMSWLPLLLIGDFTLAIRLLRVLRLLKLFRYLKALHLFLSSLQDTLEIMLVVAFTILIIVAISGNLMFILEPATVDNAFAGSWWSLVTMTTVGYGDIVPVTTAGKILASVLMVTGITIFAMLTGTVSVKISQIVNCSHHCHHCSHAIAAEFGFCPYCGEEQGLQNMTACVKCGHLHDDVSRFCAQCGESTDNKEQ